MRSGGLILSVLILTAGCRKPPAPSGPTTQYLVLIDLSASRVDKTRAADQAFVSKVASSLNFGDEIVFLPVQQDGLRDLETAADFKMTDMRTAGYPTSQDRDNLDGDRQTVLDTVPKFFDVKPNTKIMHTDLLATLKLAAGYAHDSRANRTEVIILSDMLQSAEGIEMEHGLRMPAPGWLENQERNAQLPNLHGACVAVIGEDTASRLDPEVQRFWRSYFEMSMAHLGADDIRPRAPESPNSICRSIRS